MTTLFRKEVYEHKHSSRSAGTAILTPPRLAWLALALCAALLLVALLLLIFGKYARYETVPGYLVPDGGIAQIPATVPGVVVRVLAREGEYVKAGQPLAEISRPLVTAEWGDTGVGTERKLLDKRRRIEQGINEQRRLQLLKNEDGGALVSSLRAQQAQISVQLGIQRTRLRTATNIYRMWLQADSRVISKMQLAQQHDSVLRIQSQISELTRQTLQIGRSIQEARSRQMQRVSEAHSARLSLEKQLADVDQAIYDKANSRSAMINAPNDAVVGPIYATTGQSLQMGEPLLSLYRVDAPLLAELWVPPRSAGFIRAGQRVLLRYRSFPYQRFGQQPGAIRSVSSTAINPASARFGSATQPTTAGYRVVVELERSFVASPEGARLSLRPGLEVDAAIQLEQRSLAEWLFEPIYGAARRWRDR